jgi:hypothetical protein
MGGNICRSRTFINQPLRGRDRRKRCIVTESAKNEELIGTGKSVSELGA